MRPGHLLAARRTYSSPPPSPVPSGSPGRGLKNDNRPAAAAVAAMASTPAYPGNTVRPFAITGGKNRLLARPQSMPFFSGARADKPSVGRAFPETVKALRPRSGHGCFSNRPANRICVCSMMQIHCFLRILTVIERPARAAGRWRRYPIALTTVTMQQSRCKNELSDQRYSIT